MSLLIAGRSVRDVKDEAGAREAIMEFSIPRYLAVVKEKNVYVLLVLKFLGAIATGSLSAALPYFAEHILGDPSKSTYGLAIYVAVSALVIPLWNKSTQRYDKRRLLLIGCSATALVLLAVGLFVNENAVLWYYVGCVLLGLAMSSYLLIPYSLVPDLVDYYEHKTGERHESVFFGLWITVHQLGISFAGLILGAALDLFGYRGDAAIQTESALIAVRLAFGIIPGLFFVLTALVLQRYQVTRQVYKQVRADLDQRAAQAVTDQVGE
jgi:GPH family glycoside/pentoside/hexuronide:cation symporter